VSQGQVLLEVAGPVATVTFARPEARNAMTKTMYGQLHAICGELADRDDVRVVVLRGAGGKAFVAGSDIDIFTTFNSGADGVAYEAEMEVYTRALADLPMPTIAVLEGWTVGGGLNLAAVCDIRIATPDTRMGVPIARTVGNCLSIHNYARLVSGFGVARAKRMLMLGAFVDAEEARICGFVSEIVVPDAIDARVAEMCERIVGHAPITMRVSKQAIARVAHLVEHEAEDLITSAYGSEDFHTGVAAFRAKTKPLWRGR
jgi:enoyl-CoA hydratase